jgi:hypothetical protein
MILQHESPLEHIVQHPLIEVPVARGPLTPNRKDHAVFGSDCDDCPRGVLLIALVPCW